VLYLLHLCNCSFDKQERKKAEAAAAEAGDAPTDETVTPVTATSAKQEDVVNDGQPIQHANLNRARQGGKRPPTRSLKAFPAAAVTAAAVTDAGVTSSTVTSDAAAGTEEQPDVSKLAIDDSTEQ
jgi:hypothetical protein